MKIMLAAILLALPLHAQDLTAADIMSRVAANQDRAEAERTHYVYVQHARLSSRKGKTVQCEEITDSRVTPGAAGSQQTLLTLDGRLLKGKTYQHYTELPKPKQEDTVTADDKNPKKELHEADEDSSTDQDLVENLRKNLTSEKSKDGLHAGLFPLTGKAQAQYDFVLKGRERRNDRDTFHITFKPKDTSDYDWRGDAWIDTEAFQPVVVQTALNKNIPFAVRTLLGTSLPGLGFAATYAPQPSGAWFPTTFGSEFKINVLFFFHRTVAIAVENRDFEKTHVESRILPTTDSGTNQTPTVNGSTTP